MTHFEMELEKLRKRITDMGALAEKQLADSLDAMINGDNDLAKKIIEADTQVDLIDVKIDKLCQRIFALAQPVASDLRLIMAALKINTDIERVGDLAVSIAKKVESISEDTGFLKEYKIDQLAMRTKNIYTDSLNCFIFRDSAAAYKVIEDAPEISEDSDRITNEIISAMMKKSEVIVVAANLILILRHLKRLSDHATNIAESVVFMVEGKNIKHSK